MKTAYSILRPKSRNVAHTLLLLCICTAMDAQEVKHHHAEDSTDVFFRHLNLNELTVTGITGDTKLKHATAPISIISPQVLRATASTNIIDAIAHQPGINQLTTGSSISKPIIRGLGYNRVVVMSEGVRQEGQQWGDEVRNIRPTMASSATTFQCQATNRALSGTHASARRWHTPIRTNTTDTCLAHSFERELDG